MALLVAVGVDLRRMALLSCLLIALLGSGQASSNLKYRVISDTALSVYYVFEDRLVKPILAEERRGAPSQCK